MKKLPYLILALAVILWAMIILQELIIHQIIKRQAILEDYLIRTNRNEQVLDNKLNQLHDQQHTFEFRIVPQGQVN